MPSKAKELPEILTRMEAAEYLRISLRSIDYLIAARQIPFRKIGKRSVRFEKGAVLNWLRHGDAASN